MLVRYLLRRIVTLVVVTLAIIYFVSLATTLQGRPELPVLGFLPGWQTLKMAGERSWAFLQGTAQGDLGVIPTVYGEEPITNVLWFSFRNSLGLLLMALGLAAFCGLLLGILAALTRRKTRLYTFLFLSFVGVSVPSFFLAVVLQNLGIRYTRTFGSRLVSMAGYAWDWEHLALPLIVLAARPVAYIARATYVSLLDIMREDYIRTAFAKGFSLPRTVVRHALRNLAVPFLTSSGVSLRFSLSALALVEVIFAWPGMGRRMLEGINEGVPMLVIAIAVMIGLLLQLVNLLLDLIYLLVDPRLREEGQA